MPTTFKPLKPEDFDLSAQEVRELVLGAQRFVPPGDDLLDDERLTVPEIEEP